MEEEQMRILRKSVLFLFLVVTLAIGLFAAACGEKSVTLSFVTNGGDTAGMSKEELLAQAEVFAMPDGKYLIVEG